MIHAQLIDEDTKRGIGHFEFISMPCKDEGIQLRDYAYVVRLVLHTPEHESFDADIIVQRYVLFMGKNQPRSIDEVKEATGATPTA